MIDITEFRKAFINRLTKDRKGYCAPFFFFNETDESDLKNAILAYSGTDAEMILNVFDAAVKDVYRNRERRRRREVKKDYELRKDQQSRYR